MNRSQRRSQQSQRRQQLAKAAKHPARYTDREPGESLEAWAQRESEIDKLQLEGLDLLDVHVGELREKLKTVKPGTQRHDQIQEELRKAEEELEELEWGEVGEDPLEMLIRHEERARSEVAKTVPGSAKRNLAQKKLREAEAERNEFEKTYLP
ncbi:MAG: hypothetical protein OXF66_06080 [Gammaproteobacteria bacterium]|nr:hypothetical protein [Gammaproteobacteria bacterium]